MQKPNDVALRNYKPRLFPRTLTSREPRHSRLSHIPPGWICRSWFSSGPAAKSANASTFIPGSMDAERSPIQCTLSCAEVGIIAWDVRPENAIYTRTQGFYAFVQRPQWMYPSIKPSTCVIVTDSVQLAPKPLQFPFFPKYQLPSMCNPSNSPQLGPKLGTSE